METGTQHKLHPLSIIVIALALVGIVYLFSLKYIPPDQVITPDNYPAGTKVSLYHQIPPGFPGGVVLEDKELNYAGTVTTKEGLTRITVSYISDSTLSDLVSMYQASLGKGGWQVSLISNTKKMAIIKASKRKEELLISMAPLKDQVLLTFKYEK